MAGIIGSLVLIALIGYLWGSIPAGYWMGKLLRGKDFDIRNYGSHKTGMTNVLRTLGKGKLAIAKENLGDPYLLALDSAILMSHRYELLRFWNAGAVSSCYSAAPTDGRALVQIVFYALQGTDAPSVRIAGPYRTAKLLTIERDELRAVPFELQPGAIEVHLPAASQYAALELAI